MVKEEGDKEETQEENMTDGRRKHIELLLLFVAVHTECKQMSNMSPLIKL